MLPADYYIVFSPKRYSAKSTMSMWYNNVFNIPLQVRVYLRLTATSYNGSRNNSRLPIDKLKRLFFLKKLQKLWQLISISENGRLCRCYETVRCRQKVLMQTGRTMMRKTINQKSRTPLQLAKSANNNVRVARRWTNISLSNAAEL